MIKLICTSPKFEGEMRLVYNDDNLLQVVDVEGSTMNHEQIDFLIRKVPVVYNQHTFLESFGKASLTVVPESYEVTFDQFWELYDHKVNRKLCEPIWNKLTQAERVAAFVGVYAYMRYLQKVTRGKADPVKYLAKKYWNTEWSKLKV